MTFTETKVMTTFPISTIHKKAKHDLHCDLVCGKRGSDSDIDTGLLFAKIYVIYY